jgi:D-alanyl-D-alanine carboxypeptidase (penicillin-binding protein 5/6)
MIKRVILVAFLALLSGLGVVFFQFKNLPAVKLVAPILENSKQKLADNLWFPKVEVAHGNLAPPNISSEAAFFVDTKTGEVLYQKNPHEKLSIASLTKIMTVIVAMEHKSLKDSFTVSANAAGMEPDHMQLIAGEKLTLEELLDGVFLVSANDAAEAIAEGSVGGRDEFIKLMNGKAASLGMKDSLFINPTGLEEDLSKQYSTAYDVALMSRYAISQWPALVNISSNPQIILPQTATHQDYTLFSGINLLTTYPGVVGFKTGYTPEAGLTLVTLARKNGHEVLGVLLNSGDRRGEARELLDYSFKRLGN